MKKLIFSLAFFALLPYAQAELLGKIGNSKDSHVKFALYDYSGDISMEIRVDGQGSKRSLREGVQLSPFLYDKLFRSSYEKVKVEIQHRETKKEIFSAEGHEENRTVRYERISYNDPGTIIFKKSVVTIQMDGAKASVRVQVYRPALTKEEEELLNKAMSGQIELNEKTINQLQLAKKKLMSGELKITEDNKADDLKVDRSGIPMYGDNPGWPLGRVITWKNLRKALADPTTENFGNVCEQECP